MKDMREYKSKYAEKVQDDNVAIIIKMLRDESFGNSVQRGKMVKALVDLFHIDNVDARIFFKKLGMAMTQIGDDMLSNDDVINDIVKKYDNR
jgi:hypothetical protein